MDERELGAWVETYAGIPIWYSAEREEFFFIYRGETYTFPTRTRAKLRIHKLREAEIEEAERLIEELPPVEPPEVPEVPEPPPEEPPVEPPEEPPEEVVVPELVIPELPWYAAWLKPVITFIGALTESVVNYFAPIFSPISEAVIYLGDLPENLLRGLVQKAGDLMAQFRDKGTTIALDTVTEIATGTPVWMKNLQDELEKLYAPIMKSYSEALSVETYEKSPLSGEQAVDALVDMKGKLLATSIVHFGVHALVEAGSIGQFEFMKDLQPIVTSKFGMDRLIERATMLPLEKAILIPAEYEWSSRHPNMIPTYTDLINMVVKEVIDLDRFKEEMLKLGFRPEWAQFIWDAHFIPPSWDQLLMSYYRGAITREELDLLKILVDLDPRYDVVWDSLIEVIPPYSELVNELVKEVLTLEEFTGYMKWYGFDEAWAKRIWDAHFTPPALGDLLTAWRRGLITEDRLDDLMILVDLDPRFKEIFDTRKYVDPTLRQGRFMFETGAIDEERVKEIVLRQGLHPDDADEMVAYLTTFQERSFRTSYLRALATGIIYGAYTEDELKEQVKEAGYSDAVAEWMIKTAEVREATITARRKAPRPKLLTLGNLKKAYIDDIIAEDDLRRDIMVMGYEVGDVDILVRLLDTEKTTEEAGGRKLALSQSELLNAWRYGEATEDYVRTELQLRGLPTEDVERLIATKKKQWGIEIE